MEITSTQEYGKLKHRKREHAGDVPNVGLNTNTRRGSECMETDIMRHHSN